MLTAKVNLSFCAYSEGEVKFLCDCLYDAQVQSVGEQQYPAWRGLTVGHERWKVQRHAPAQTFVSSKFATRFNSLILTNETAASVEILNCKLV